MAPSPDFTSGEPVVKRPARGTPVKFLIPLIYAPILPLTRIVLRHNPVVRDRLFFGVLACAFAHGAYLVYFLKTYQIEFLETASKYSEKQVRIAYKKTPRYVCPIEG